MTLRRASAAIWHLFQPPCYGPIRGVGLPALTPETRGASTDPSLPRKRKAETIATPRTRPRRSRSRGRRDAAHERGPPAESIPPRGSAPRGPGDGPLPHQPREDDEALFGAVERVAGAQHEALVADLADDPDIAGVDDAVLCTR